MNAKAHILRNVKLEGWREKIVGRWSYRELAVDDQGRVYLGENDNHERSSYLWSVAFD